MENFIENSGDNNSLVTFNATTEFISELDTLAQSRINNTVEIVEISDVTKETSVYIGETSGVNNLSEHLLEEGNRPHGKSIAINYNHDLVKIEKAFSADFKKQQLQVKMNFKNSGNVTNYEVVEPDNESNGIQTNSNSIQQPDNYIDLNDLSKNLEEISVAVVQQINPHTLAIKQHDYNKNIYALQNFQDTFLAMGRNVCDLPRIDSKPRQLVYYNSMSWLNGVAQLAQLSQSKLFQNIVKVLTSPIPFFKPIMLRLKENEHIFSLATQILKFNQNHLIRIHDNQVSSREQAYRNLNKLLAYMIKLDRTLHLSDTQLSVNSYLNHMRNEARQLGDMTVYHNLNKSKDLILLYYFITNKMSVYFHPNFEPVSCWNDFHEFFNHLPTDDPPTVYDVRASRDNLETFRKILKEYGDRKFPNIENYDLP